MLSTTMSLPRIFDLARKLGTPVIMTDAEGREPLVVLPLDQFEALAGVSADAPVTQPVEYVKLQSTAKESVPTRTDTVTNAPTTPVDSLPIEERFYLEPLDGEQG